MPFIFTPKIDFKRFFVGEGPQKPPYFLHHRRVYILPTKQGLIFTLLLFVMLLGSINYSNSLGYFLTFLLASVAVVAIFHTYNNLLHLSIGPAICAPVFAAEPSEKQKNNTINNSKSGFTVQIDNRGFAARFSLQAFTAKDYISIQDIDKNSLNTLYLQHRYKQRGQLPLPRFTLETRFPFGLFRAWTFVELDQTQLVYPKPANDTTLPIKNTGHSTGQKQENSGTEDFKSLRTYVEGDPLQHVHWKSYARHHTMQTKEFSDTTADDLWLNWSDTTATGTENKLSQLTRWVLLADTANLAYGLHLPGITIKPTSGQQHLHSCLKQLALFNSNEAVA
jgi:uncharacterized protein (DUF58 family)